MKNLNSDVNRFKESAIDEEAFYSPKEENLEFSEPVNPLSMLCRVGSGAIDEEAFYSPKEEDLEFSEPVKDMKAFLGIK